MILAPIQYTGEVWSRDLYKSGRFETQYNYSGNTVFNATIPAVQGSVAGSTVANVYPKLVFDIVNTNSSITLLVMILFSM